MNEHKGVIRTKQAFKNALVFLLQEKELNEITVKEILLQAGYARGTFYAHYSYKEILLDEIVSETIEGFVIAFKEPYEGKKEQYNINNLSLTTVKIFHYIGEHQAVFNLFYKKGNNDFQEKFTEAIKKIFDEEFDLFFPGTPEQVNREVIVSHHVYSLLGLIAYWIKSGYAYSATYMTDQMLKITSLKYTY